MARGPRAIEDAFADRRYDLILMLGVYHKLRREITPDLLSSLMKNLGARARMYFAWSGYPEEMPIIDLDMHEYGLRRIHTSELAGVGHPAAIWQRL